MIHNDGAQEQVMANLMARFVKDETGATSVEYAMIAAFISIVILSAAQQIGAEAKTSYQRTLDSLQ